MHKNISYSFGGIKSFKITIPTYKSIVLCSVAFHRGKSLVILISRFISVGLYWLAELSKSSNSGSFDFENTFLYVFVPFSQRFIILLVIPIWNKCNVSQTGKSKITVKSNNFSIIEYFRWWSGSILNRKLSSVRNVPIVDGKDMIPRNDINHDVELKISSEDKVFFSHFVGTVKSPPTLQWAILLSQFMVDGTPLQIWSICDYDRQKSCCHSLKITLENNNKIFSHLSNKEFECFIYIYSTINFTNFFSTDWNFLPILTKKNYGNFYWKFMVIKSSRNVSVKITITLFG